MPRAVGIIRVSQTNGREGESFHSPAIQRTRITDECERQGFDLIEVHEELDISGGRPLADRPGLRCAVEAVEAGDADVIVASYLDRLTRSVRVRDELVERVETAGGMVLTVDMGIQTNATASQWFTGTLSSAVGEYLRRTSAERSALAQQRAIDRGVAPYPAIPPGYRRIILGRRPNGLAIHGSLEPHPEVAPIVVEAFRMRAKLMPLAEIRAYLAENGIHRSYHGVTHMLASRIYLGEIHFGGFVPNLEAHEPIIDKETFEQVTSTRLPRGRKAKSERLLARLGVLVCANCGARMVVASSHNGKYPVYRCPPNGDCTKHVTISATMAEEALSDAARKALGDLEGSASTDDEERRAIAAAEAAQDRFDAALKAFDGMEGESAARERLVELRQGRDETRAQVEHLADLHSAITIRLSRDWDRLSPAAKREIIGLVVKRAAVHTGRGPERLEVELVDN